MGAQALNTPPAPQLVPTPAPEAEQSPNDFSDEQAGQIFRPSRMTLSPLS